jgi:hypothetical protein
MADEQVSYTVTSVTDTTMLVRYSVGEVYVDVSLDMPPKGTNLNEYIARFTPRANLEALLNPTDVDKASMVGMSGAAPLVPPPAG